MLKKTKKIISVILAVVMVFSIALPATAAYEEYPTIYVTGAQTNDIYCGDKKVSDFSIDLEAVLEEHGKDLIKEFLFGMISDDYKTWAGKFHDIFIGIYGDSALDKNGEASNGSKPKNHSSTVYVEEKTSGYGIWDYRFWYDWRISPMITGEELAAYIDRVLVATGKEKVNLVGRCYGANVIAAYVETHKEHAVAHIDDIAYFAPSIDGIDFMTAIYTGEIYLDPEAVDNFANWFIENEDLIEDKAVASLITTLIELFNHAQVLGFTADKIDLLVDRIKSDLLPPLLRDSFASWPSYWTMVTEGNLDKAINFIFADCKDEYAGLIEKIRDYYENVQVNRISTVKEMMSKGVRYNIFAKYNFPEYPIYKGAAVQSDGDTPIPRQTFGATSANYGDTLSDDYIATITEENLKYLSPDHKIDASTGLLPENTWYIKNLHHNHWGSIEPVSLVIMNNDYDVSNQDVYPQFMDNNTGMKEVTPDEDYKKPEDNALVSFMRFLTAVFNFIAKLFSGELSLDELLKK